MVLAALSMPVQETGSAPPGKLVDIGGRRLHLHCTGSGAPTVVLETGAGDPAAVWALVQPELARFTRVCGYDRAGYAWSDPGPEPRSLRQIAFELHTLLTIAGEKPPYVLVGHSLGGLFARAFNRDYSQDVAGLVFVDSTTEDTTFLNYADVLMRLRERARGRVVPPITTGMWTPAPTDPFLVPADIRLPPTRNHMARLPVEDQRVVMASRQQLKWQRMGRSEQDYLGEEVKEFFEARTVAVELGSKPIVVLARERTELLPGMDAVVIAKQDADRLRAQAEIARLSTKGHFKIVAETRHHIQLDQPSVVVEAIRTVIAALQVRRTPHPAARFDETGSDVAIVVKPRTRAPRRARVLVA